MSGVKALNGTASETVTASIEDCFAFFEAIDRYPDWHPEVVREVDVVQRGAGGEPTQARTKLHVARGPLVKDFNLLMDVAARRPEAVMLTRRRHGPSDPEEFEVRWHLREQNAGTNIRLEVEANLSVPRLVPVGGIGDAIAAGFVVAAARALRG